LQSASAPNDDSNICAQCRLFDRRLRGKNDAQTARHDLEIQHCTTRAPKA